MAKLFDCKLNLCESISQKITVPEKIINNLAICDITIDDAWRKFYMLSTLSRNNKWRNFVSTLKLTEKADTVGNITSHLLLFEATLPGGKGLSFMPHYLKQNRVVAELRPPMEMVQRVNVRVKRVRASCAMDVERRDIFGRNVKTKICGSHMLQRTSQKLMQI